MTEVPQEDEEEKAREEAVARRQKILQSSQDRLGVVTGVVEEPEEVKSKGLSKMAAARRRRFKKKDDESNQNETTKEDSAAAAEGGGESTPAGAGADAAPSTDVAAPELTGEEVKEQEPETASADVPAPEPESVTAESVSASTSNKKKYRGVARIRREMLKDKQQRKADEEHDDHQHLATRAATTDAAHHAHPTQRTLKLYNTFPILMHVVTVLLLFGAGLDVGLQQSPAPTAEIHPLFAPRQELHILRAFSKSKSSSLPSADELLQQAESQELLMEKQDEEFQVSDGSGGISNTETNIDPLFGVDLDLYTQGDGLYMTLARGAIKLHRVNLNVFYYFPLRIVLFIKQTLLQFTKSPPLLCLVAIVLRQVVAKGILGANLPKPDKENEPQKDVLGMAKQFLQAFLTRAFPTVFTLYDIFSHLKSDIFVILFGLFCGLCFRHSSPPQEVVGVGKEKILGVGTDEL